MPNWTHSFYHDPAYKKKMSDAVRRPRAKETPAQRLAHNRAIARSYRRTVGLEKLQRTDKYGQRKTIRRWMEDV